MKYIKNILGYIGIGLTLSCCGKESQGGVISFLFAWTDKNGYILHQGHPYRVQLEYVGPGLINGTGLAYAQTAWEDPTQWHIIVNDERTIGDSQTLTLEVDPKLSPPPQLTCISYLCGGTKSSTWLDQHLHIYVDPDNAQNSHAYLGTLQSYQQRSVQDRTAPTHTQLAERFQV